jgi:hypothetical protein
LVPKIVAARSAVISGVGNHPRIAEHGIDHRIIGRLVALGWHESNPDITTSPSTGGVGQFRLDPGQGNARRRFDDQSGREEPD